MHRAPTPRSFFRWSQDKASLYTEKVMISFQKVITWYQNGETGWREVHVVMLSITALLQWKQGVCFPWLASCWFYREKGRGLDENRFSYSSIWSIWFQCARQSRSLVLTRIALCVVFWHCVKVCFPTSLNDSLIYNIFFHIIDWTVLFTTWLQSRPQWGGK